MRPAIIPSRSQSLNRKRSVGGPILLSVLGSTGSIGRSTLDVVRRNREAFRIVGLSAGTNVELLAQQITEFSPSVVATATLESANVLASLVKSETEQQIEILHGSDGIAQVAGDDRAETVVAAIVGIAGLRSVLAALRAGKRVALANKESLVCAPHLVKSELDRHGGEIIPVDSEHSAIFQALQGEQIESLSRVILTASGGPFLKRDPATLHSITPQEAIRHPRWSMGAKISIDSATLMNKTLEVIEAAWLFGLDESRISVLIHPESIVHSLIELVDGSQIAQLSVPDMRGAIAYALSYPSTRLPNLMERLDLGKLGALNFTECDEERFPAISLGREVLRQGGAMPAVLNIANEEAVHLFINGQIRFDEIVSTVARQVEKYSSCKCSSLDELEALSLEIRGRTEETLSK